MFTKECNTIKHKHFTKCAANKNIMQYCQFLFYSIQQCCVYENSIIKLDKYESPTFISSMLAIGTKQYSKGFLIPNYPVELVINKQKKGSQTIMWKERY